MSSMMVADALQGKPHVMRLSVEEFGMFNNPEYAEVPLSSEMLARLLKARVMITEWAAKDDMLAEAIYNQDDGTVKFWDEAEDDEWGEGDLCEVVPGDSAALNMNRSKGKPFEPEVWLHVTPDGFYFRTYAEEGSGYLETVAVTWSWFDQQA